jgi:GTP cyclohydrolase I
MNKRQTTNVKPKPGRGRSMQSDNEMDGYEKIDRYNPKHIKDLSSHYSSIISGIGEKVNREGLLKTPERAAKALTFLMHGYDTNPDEILKSALFTDPYQQMVIVKDIEIYSMCEHHMLPFFGKAHVAYIPNGHIVGLSKIPRVVDAFARRLQVQERLTTEIRDCIQRTLKPLGVAVVIEAKHLCMLMRGIQKQNSVATTSAFTGEFVNEKTRAEFIRLISANLS